MSRMPSTRRMLSPPGGILNSSSPGMMIFGMIERRLDHGGRLHRLVHALERDPRAAEARHRPAVERVVDELLHPGGIQDRDHHVDEMEFGLVRGGGGFRRVVVAHQGEHAAVLGGAGEIGVAEHVAGAVDARPLAVPHAEHAVVLALAAQLGLLRAPDARSPRGPRSGRTGRGRCACRGAASPA